MQILTRLNKVVAYSENGYTPIGNSAVCMATGESYDNALIVVVECVPTDIDQYEYHYMDGKFVKGDKKAAGKRVTGGGEVFNDQGNNQAVGHCTHAEGMGTKAMGKVFGIVSMGADGKITLSHSADGILSAGMVYSCQLASTFNDVGKITSVKGSVINVDAVPDSIALSGSDFTSIDGNFLWIPSNPEAGIMDVFSQATHAEGMNTTASGVGAHAEGRGSHACGKYSHAEGRDTQAYYGAHAEGQLSRAVGVVSHAEGFQTESIGKYSHAEGYQSKSKGDYSHAEGRGVTAHKMGDHAEGYGTNASGTYSHAEGISSVASGEASHAEGQSIASGSRAHSEGRNTEASGNFSHAEGDRSKATAIYSHAEGVATEASGEASHAEGFVTKATAKGAHAEGVNTEAVTEGAHAEGNKTSATGHYSHAEGNGTKATAQGAHAEGNNTQATSYDAHAEGNGTKATGEHSHAEGYNTEASGWASHAAGHGTKATINSQTVVGRWNEEESDSLFVVGNGSSEKRSTAMAVKGNGVLRSAGANRTLFTGMLAIGDMVGKDGFNLCHYSVVNLIMAGTGSCIASVRKEGNFYVIEGVLAFSYATGAGTINNIKITTNAGFKVTEVEITRFLMAEICNVEVHNDFNSAGMFITDIIGLVPIC